MISETGGENDTLYGRLLHFVPLRENIIKLPSIQCQWEQRREVIYYLSLRRNIQLLLGASNIADF